ncbi:MAG: hypothetical protein JNM01_12660 [Delftia acidovorans]|nr:hypothetical protein [Delftia acidovorans]
MNQRDHFYSGIRHGQAAQASDSIQAQPVSPVEVSLDQFEAGLRDLRETVQRLSLRLAPVLMPSSGMDEGSNSPNAVPAPQAPLVDRVDTLVGHLRHDRAALQDLERRLAL